MKALLALFIILTVIFGLTTVFLAREMLRKLGFVGDFANESNHMVVWNYPGAVDRDPGQRNIVLRGKQPFVVLVGFKLDIPLLGYSGTDVFGYVRSDDQGVAVVSVYQGNGSAEFRFLVDTDVTENPITVTSTDADQDLTPTADYPPHFWQKWGIYG